MRAMMQTGPLLLALGVALTGCNQAGNGPAKSTGGDGNAGPVVASDSDYVLTVEGMV